MSPAPQKQIEIPHFFTVKTAKALIIAHIYSFLDYCDKEYINIAFTYNQLPIDNRECLLGENRYSASAGRYSDNMEQTIGRKGPTVFSTPYSRQYGKICNIIKKYMPILLYDPSLEKVMKGGYRCVARKAPTLGKTVSPSLFLQANNSDNSTWLSYKGSVGCGHRICTCCTVMTKISSITSFANGNSFNIQHYINCNSRNIIYVINCNSCQLQYVGHTTQKLKQRICKHLSDIPHAISRNVSAASQHFFSVHNGNISSLSVIAAEKVFPPIRGGDLKRKLLNRETFWMYRLQTTAPSGLNYRQDMILHY